jgi:hypothetical protein
MNTILIDDPEIIQFYIENPHLDIVTMNHIFIDIIKKLSTNLTTTLENTVQNQILTIVNELKGELYKLNNDIIRKMYDTKKEYIDDVKLLLSNNELSTQEKFNHIIEKGNDAILTKTTLLINDVVPKSQDKSYTQIEKCIKTCLHSITEDTQKILKTSGTDKSGEIIDKIEKNFNKMVSVIQQPLFNAIQTSEARTQTTIQQINDSLIGQKKEQETLTGELNTFLNKYKTNSSVKGAVSETELYCLLQSIAPSDEIIRCSKEIAYCDIRLNRKNKRLPTILFENKDYAASVNTDEIEKFERDLKIRKCHGIFISQNSPITYKENFHIDIINNLIHLYIPNAKYDREKIKLAINIVDSLVEKLNLINKEQTGIHLSLDEIENLKEEYREFANKKSDILDTIKLITKQLTEKLDDLDFPFIKKIAISHADNKNLGIVCDICHNFTGKNKASLSAHMKACKGVKPTEAVSHVQVTV